jgi:anion-transporting  ArsA/GET3 family ATPase
VNVAEVLEGKEICVCAGAGGVGKTSTAAAVALGMAQQGGKVAVVTIDPARRLANSLGLKELGNEASRIDPRRFRRAGLEVEGELWAMMLDPKRTFDELIERRAPDAETRDAVLSNRIYKEISDALGGSQEFMAMEKLYELHEEGGYDLIVLDTPPTRNALDFLDAPERLSRFVDSRSLQFFMSPGRRGLGLLGKGTGLLFSVLRRATGIDLLKDLSDFFNAFGGMSEDFRARAGAVNELLADRRTAFLLVTSPQRDAVDEALFFEERLRSGKLPFGAVVVNRMHDEVEPRAAGKGLERKVSDLLGEELGRKVTRNLEDYRRLAERDRTNVADLEGRLRAGEPMFVIPYLDDDVHDIKGLVEMNAHLFADD